MLKQSRAGASFLRNYRGKSVRVSRDRASIARGSPCGAVAAGFLLKRLGNVQECFGVLGVCALLAAFCAVAIRFSAAHKTQESALYEKALQERRASLRPSPVLVTAAEG